MIKIAIFGSCHQINSAKHIKQLFTLLKEKNVNVLIEKDFCDYLYNKFQIDILEDIITDKNFEADFAISIGGDGTFLRTARYIGDKNIPILGINSGRLGFLADVPLDGIETALEKLWREDYHIEERSLLEMYIDGYSENYIKYGLNEVAILKQNNSSMITIRVDINTYYLNTYEADGLIVSTPTGSTAYSLSVVGPIIEPATNNMVISPVAPHSLTTRPLVISDNYTLRIDVESRSESFLVSVDGISYSLKPENYIVIKKAPYKINVVKLNGHTFYDTLRDKLMWGVDRRI